MWFKRKSKRPAPRAPRRPTVQVAYREFGDPVPEGTGGSYAYRWPLELGKPKVGDRVWVPVEDFGLVEGVVTGFGRNGYDGPLKLVHRKATEKELQDARHEEGRP